MKRVRVLDISMMGEEYPRPTGSLYFADPSTVTMTRDIHTFSDWRCNNNSGEQTGIRSLTPWSDPHPEMNRKRGVREAD